MAALEFRLTMCSRNFALGKPRSTFSATIRRYRPTQSTPWSNGIDWAAERRRSQNGSDVNDPFLVDECLSPDLVALAHARGHAATHVVYRGQQGAEDTDLMPIIRAGDFVLVTNNQTDFVRLYRREEAHSGLIIVVPGGIEAEEQVRLFGAVLDVIEPLADIINKLVRVQRDGQVTIEDLP